MDSKFKLNVASKNQAKLDAVREAVKEYSLLRNAEIVSVEVKNRATQPKTQNETINGAIFRAESSFVDCKYSFGIESGLMEVAHAQSGHMEFTVCVIYDGKNRYLGFSSAFELPPKTIESMTEKGMDLNEAAYACGITEDPKIGASQGIIGVLTEGIVTREGYTRQAIHMALIPLMKSEFYQVGTEALTYQD